MDGYKLIERGSQLKNAKKALILLHGRGGSALDILQLYPYFCDALFYVAALEAPNNSWYPHSFMAKTSTNEPELTNSINAIKNLIDKIAEHIPHEQIYLMGFSQGACLSLEVSARHARKFGGIIAFSGGLIGDILETSNYKGDFQSTKVFLGNSDVDPFIPLDRTVASHELMLKLNAASILKIYPGMRHTINQDEIDTVKQNIFI